MADSNQGIHACMRLNAKLQRRIDILNGALETFAGTTPCSGPMTVNDDGSPFSPEMAASMRKAHAKSCVRCIARQAIEDAVLTAEASEAQLARMAGEYERRYMAILGPELTKRREEQDASHGGPKHDDTHTPEDWCRFIQDYAYRARIAAIQGSEVSDSLVPIQANPDHAEYENRMFDVAALAISAILSSRRKSGQTDSVKQPFSPQTFSGKDESA